MLSITMDEENNNGDNLKCIHRWQSESIKFSWTLNINLNMFTFITYVNSFPSSFLHHANAECDDGRKRQTKIEIKHKFFSNMKRIFSQEAEKTKFFVSKTIWRMPFFAWAISIRFVGSRMRRMRKIFVLFRIKWMTKKKLIMLCNYITTMIAMQLERMNEK